jgi:hypothetical protein
MKPPSKPQSTAGGIGESCFLGHKRAGASLRSTAAKSGCAPVAQAVSDRRLVGYVGRDAKCVRTLVKDGTIDRPGVRSRRVKTQPSSAWLA